MRKASHFFCAVCGLFGKKPVTRYCRFVKKRPRHSAAYVGSIFVGNKLNVHSLVEARRFPTTEENWKKRKKMPKNRTMTGSVGTPVSSAYLLPTCGEKRKKTFRFCHIVNPTW